MIVVIFSWHGDTWSRKDVHETWRRDIFTGTSTDEDCMLPTPTLRESTPSVVEEELRTAGLKKKRMNDERKIHTVKQRYVIIESRSIKEQREKCGRKAGKVS